MSDDILNSWNQMDVTIESKMLKEEDINKIEKYKDVIAAGGWYQKCIVIKNSKREIWNSLKVIDGKFYRDRIETLIINDKEELFIQLRGDMTYRIPGGSTEKDLSRSQQAVNETKEEARINLSKIYSTGLTYTIDKISKWMNELNVPYDGSITEIYIGKYRSRFGGTVHIEDADIDMFKYGKFYPIKDLLKILKPIHIEALKMFYDGKLTIFNEVKNGIVNN